MLSGKLWVSLKANDKAHFPPLSLGSVCVSPEFLPENYHCLAKISDSSNSFRLLRPWKPEVVLRVLLWIAINNSPFWQVFPSPMSCMSAGHEHCTFQWRNDVQEWLQPPLLNVQESGNNKENIKALAKMFSWKKSSICPYKPKNITFSNNQHNTHLPCSRHIYLALRKSAVMYRVDCKGFALPR